VSVLRSDLMRLGRIGASQSSVIDTRRRRLVRNTSIGGHDDWTAATLCSDQFSFLADTSATDVATMQRQCNDR
jgi:hypothetical protein